MFVSYVVVVIRYSIIGVVLLRFVVVDDRIVADVGYGIARFVDSCVLRVDIGKVGGIIHINITVPSVFVNCNVVVIGDLVGG